MQTRMRYPTLLALLLIVLLGTTAVGQSGDLRNSSFEAIDQHVADTPAGAAGSIDSLAKYLVSAAKTDLEKARSIYKWVISNVSYDVEAFESGDYGDQSAEAVFVTRRTLCGGYSNLFHALCKAAGVPSEVLFGYSRGFGYVTGAPLDPEPDHAWNSVKIGDKWYLLDATWASGYVDGRGQFVRKPFDHYFLTPPDQFIYDHLPQNEKWQLLDKPMAKAEFEQLVYLRPAFFRNRLQVVSNPKGIIDSDCCFAVVLGGPDDVMLSAEVNRGRDKDESAFTFVQRDGADLRLNTVIPRAGKYTLRLFCKRKDGSNTYEWAADYSVKVAKDADTVQGFPKTFSTFQEKDASVIAPMSGRLKAGTTETFKMRAPGADAVAVIVDGQWSNLARNGDVFEGTATIKGQTIQIAARFPGNESYFVLLKYDVVS